MAHSKEKPALTTINPTHGLPIRTYGWDSTESIETKIELGNQAFAKWKTLSVLQRTGLLTNLASSLRLAKSELAHSMAVEMGKPLPQGEAEIEKCAKLCEFIEQVAPTWLAEDVRDWAGNRRAIVAPQPLGLILGIMPWNFPCWQVFRFAIPTLAAGNVVLIKHADITTGTAILLQSLFESAGLPSGTYQTLFIDHSTAARVIASPEIRGVSLTGSERAGSEVASLAGRYLKKTVLELGGSDPYLVLEDADLDLAARVCSDARFLNAGQTCVAAKRFIVMDSVYETFRDKIVANARARILGDPLQPGVNVGPMARADLRDNLHRQVQESVRLGARILIGGDLPAGRPTPMDNSNSMPAGGFFYPVTVLENVHPGQPAFDEELFGPVACLIRAMSLNEAVTIANQTRYGLGAAVFSRDEAQALRLLRDQLQVGIGAINLPVQSTPELPFGGIGISGYGRELGREGMLEFTNLKTILLP